MMDSSSAYLLSILPENSGFIWQLAMDLDSEKQSEAKYLQK